MIATMKMTTSIKALLPLMLGVALAAFFAAPTALADDDDHVEARRLLQRGEILPLNHILQAVQGRVPGDVIEVDGRYRIVDPVFADWIRQRFPR